MVFFWRCTICLPLSVISILSEIRVLQHRVYSTRLSLYHMWWKRITKWWGFHEGNTYGWKFSTPKNTEKKNINFDLDVLFRYINLTRLAGSHNLSISFVLMNGSSFLTSNRNSFCRFVFTCVLLNYIKSGTVSHISSVSVLMV